MRRYFGYGIVLDGHPPDTRIASEPTFLAYGKLPSMQHDVGHRLVERHPTIQMREQLLVTKGLTSLARQFAGLSQTTNLGEEPRAHHRVYALLDAMRQRFARPCDAHLLHVTRWVCPGAWSEGREWFATPDAHFECALDATSVGFVGSRRGHGVKLE